MTEDSTHADTASVDATIDGASIRRLEELTLNAWPAPKQVVRDGWVGRLADGFTGRANSIHPLFDGGGDLDQRITFFETVYAAHRLPAVFKMTPASQPAGLAGALAARGYRRGKPMAVQVLDALAAVPVPDGVGCFAASDAVDAQWLEALVSFRSLKVSEATALSRIIDCIALPARFVLSLDGGTPAACGLAVLEGPWVGLYDITTRPDLLRRGHGMRVVTSLLSWARDNSASSAYLQVRCDNPPALSLYARLGFRSVYEYRYWRR